MAAALRVAAMNSMWKPAARAAKLHAAADAALRAAVRRKVILPAAALRGEPVSSVLRQDAKREKLPGALKKEGHRKRIYKPCCC